MDAVNLKQPDLYINRELSLLAFNRRVLEQAQDESVPLLERLKFLCISCTNLDEFFEIRAAGLVQRQELGSGPGGPDNMGPHDVLKAISVQAHGLVDDQYRTLNDVLIPLLEKENIRFIKRANWTAAQDDWLKRYFKNELTPVLSPMGLDPAHPFPRILNKSLNFIVSLEGKDAFGRNSALAVVQAPRSLPRLIQLPIDQKGNGPHDFVFLSSVIHAYVDDLFPGMNTTGCYQFRVTRNSDLFVDEEEVDDLLRAVEGELPSRRYGDTVRLEIADDCPENLVTYLVDHFELSQDDVYQVNGPVNLNRMIEVIEQVDRADLKYPGFTPGLPRQFTRTTDIFEVIQHQDILLHHPYESFLPVIDFVKQAASDPLVLAIKQTLYRTGPDSAIVDALVEAAKLGKEVTVVIELRARFDEAANIGLANKLQQAGAHVLYGVVGYKTHAKMCMVVRREGRKLCRYVHLGTGNYHPRTARLYTDYGLLTCNNHIAEDVHRVFMQLTSLGKFSKLRKLIQSPFTLHKTILEKIEREVAFAKQGKTAKLIFKANSLVDPQIIQALYRASMEGVQVDLIVRGMCSLRPGVAGVSERIKVRSIVGRFLEHTRVFCFYNDGDAEVYCSSADCMERNFFRRVEIAFPVETKKLKERIIQDLRTYLRDNCQAWELQSDGSYKRLSAPSGKLIKAQEILLERSAELPL
ncbi:MAG: polyphosphate kinase 1 [Gammaproteobacteria bacterium]|nr:polyphosphate kinase 1 [Gammaproteobacteria bacterium]